MAMTPDEIAATYSDERARAILLGIARRADVTEKSGNCHIDPDEKRCYAFITCAECILNGLEYEGGGEE